MSKLWLTMSISRRFLATFVCLLTDSVSFCRKLKCIRIAFCFSVGLWVKTMIIIWILLAATRIKSAQSLQHNKIRYNIYKVQAHILNISVFLQVEITGRLVFYCTILSSYINFICKAETVSRSTDEKNALQEV